MGASGKWFKSLISLKPLSQEKVGGEDNYNKAKMKKWKLWRSSSEGCGSSSSSSSSSSSKGLKMRHVAAAAAAASDSNSNNNNKMMVVDDALAAAMATIARAQPKDFRAVKREWAAIRIQTAFRALLARRALRALRAVVRIQAIFRGRQVRNQAAVTLRCMQALLRVQARVRAHTQCPSLSSQPNNPPKESHDQRGWCHSPGTLEEVRAKQQMRQEGAIKRERAIAYSFSSKLQQPRSYGSPNSRANKQPLSKTKRINQRVVDNRHSPPDWNWLERWMAIKPWECQSANYSCEQEQPLKVKRNNNVTTRIFARPPIAIPSTASGSLSAPTSESSLYDDSSTSTSCTSASPPTFSTNTLVAAAAVEDDHHTDHHKPSYMNPTESIKAKQKPIRLSSDKKHWATLSCEDSSRSSSAGSNPSLNHSREFYPPIQIARHDCLRNQWRQGR